MIHRGKESFAFSAFEAVKTIEWLYPVAALIVTNHGAELLGVLTEHGWTRAGLSAAAVIVGRAAWLWYRDNQKDVVR